MDKTTEFVRYLKSVASGNSNGQNSLVYENDIGTDKDKKKAIERYSKSAKGGDSGRQNNLEFCYDEGIGTNKDEKKAFERYLKSAEVGNSDGQNNIGWCYQHGIGTDKDEKKAFRWYFVSAKGGNSNGQNNLGWCFQHGIGTVKNEKKAFEWYLKSAEGGNSRGQNNLGFCYDEGIGTNKDEKKAFEWYLKSAEGGDSDGQNNLGVCYRNGIGTNKDEKKAFEWYLKSAEGGNSNGQNNLGWCYQHDIGTDKDEKKAFEWYLKSAEGGDSGGQNNLGFCYDEGMGTNKDAKKAFKWYLKSAKGGNSNGQYNLGLCYQHGIGTCKDERKAFEWYFKSAKGGYSGGQNNLGFCYDEGIGTDKDKKKAFEWYLKSAKNGNPEGQYEVAIRYRNGNGTLPNHEKAVEWLQRAKSNKYSKTIGNKYYDIDDFLKNLLNENKLIKWIPFNELKFMKKIGKGGFATVHTATWEYPVTDHKGGIYIQTNIVAVKLFHGSKNNCKELIKELKAYSHIGSKNPTFLQYYGISKNEVTGEYILVMQYAKMGSLRQNLHKIAQMKWEKKLELLIYIAFDLEIIHSHNIIHRNLHSGNIFQNDLYNAYIGDLGFATAINKTLDSESRGAYGALVYMAPEILRGNIFTKATDIYSLGMIMWEISSGCVVFSEYKYDSLRLAIEICEGLRPTILKSTPLCYAELLKRCWNDDQEKRPTALEIYETILNWKNNNEILVGFLKSDDEMVIEYKAFDIDSDNSIYSGKFTSYINPRMLTNDAISNNKSLNIDQNNADALRARGKVYFELGKYKESLTDLNRSLDIDPNNADALEVRSKSLHAMADIGSKEMMGVLGNILKSALNEGSFSSTEQVTKSIQQKLLNDQTLKQNQKKYLIDYLQKIGDEVSVHRQNGVKRQCEICKHSTYAKRYCEHCIHNYLRQHFKDWTSGNDMIDKIIQDCQQQTQQPHRVIEWIPFVNFKSVQRLTENSVYTAFWNNGSFANWNIEKQLLERHGGHPVTLKRLKDSNNNSSKWVREIKSHFLIDNTRQYLVQCFGMTKNPETLNFMLVMEKMDMDLRSFLRDNNHIITWEQKLKYVEIISLSLTVIHKAGYVHRDLHPGHTLIQLFNNRVISMKISGLTFCGPINEPFDDIQSIHPFIAPEVLRNQQYTYKTDIYCMGMIMWEISAGMPPFSNQDNINLKTSILEGIRPEIVKGTPSEYGKLMKECWDANPENRPNAETLYREVSKLRIEFIKKSSVESSLNDNNLVSLVETSTHPSEDKRYVTQKYNFTPEDILRLENDNYAFERNFNYGKCTDCNRFKTSKAWCQSCDPWKVIKGWTSGNKDIDNCIKEFQFEATEYEKVIEWIHFDRLDNIQEVGKGGFGYVFSATWLDGKRRTSYDGEKYVQSRAKPDIVALKNLSYDSVEFLQNFKNHMKCTLTASNLEIYGLTQNIVTNQYLMVFQYANSGNLRHYLRLNFEKLTWKDKLLRLIDIAKDLLQIHESGYIHCDFHSGNILQNKEELRLKKIIKSYIVDLGLSQNNKESTLKKGVLPYIAPEILLGRKYAQAADIYGFGVVMAEITTGIPPFDGYLFDNDLAIKICCGLRPKFAPGTPDCYFKLAETCMDSDPQKRPTAKMLFDEFSKWYGFMNEKDTVNEVDTFDESDELDEKSEISNNFREADDIIQQLPITTQQNLDGVYTSQFIDVNAISQRFSEEVKSGNITDSELINLYVKS